MPVISRIAPTPSGYLHRGNAFNFILTALLTRIQGGTLILRIDDLDTARVNPEYVQDIFDTLHWLGISWDLGPVSVDEQVATYSQSHRMANYEALIDELLRRNRVYACRCSRSTLAEGHSCPCLPLELDPEMPDTALRAKLNDNETLSFNDQLLGPVSIPLRQVMGNFVVRRRDRIPAYQVVSVAEDLQNKTSMIVRGTDLAGSTAAQLWLARALEQPSFEQVVWYHHPLLLDERQQKLSKSAGAHALKTLRDAGMKPDTFYREISHAFACDPVNSLQELITAFDEQRFAAIKSNA